MLDSKDRGEEQSLDKGKYIANYSCIPSSSRKYASEGKYEQEISSQDDTIERCVRRAPYVSTLIHPDELHLGKLHLTTSKLSPEQETILSKTEDLFRQYLHGIPSDYPDDSVSLDAKNIARVMLQSSRKLSDVSNSKSHDNTA